MSFRSIFTGGAFLGVCPRRLSQWEQEQEQDDRPRTSPPCRHLVLFIPPRTRSSTWWEPWGKLGSESGSRVLKYWQDLYNIRKNKGKKTNKGLRRQKTEKKRDLS